MSKRELRKSNVFEKERRKKVKRNLADSARENKITYEYHINHSFNKAVNELIMLMVAYEEIISDASSSKREKERARNCIINILKDLSYLEEKKVNEFDVESFNPIDILNYLYDIDDVINVHEGQKYAINLMRRKGKIPVFNEKIFEERIDAMKEEEELRKKRIEQESKDKYKKRKNEEGTFSIKFINNLFKELGDDSKRNKNSFELDKEFFKEKTKEEKTKEEKSKPLATLISPEAINNIAKYITPIDWTKINTKETGSEEKEVEEKEVGEKEIPEGVQLIEQNEEKEAEEKEIPEGVQLIEQNEKNSQQDESSNHEVNEDTSMDIVYQLNEDEKKEIEGSIEKGTFAIVETLKDIFHGMNNDITQFVAAICQYFKIPLVEIYHDQNHILSFSIDANDRITELLEENVNYVKIYSYILLAIASQISGKKITRATLNYGIEQGIYTERLKYIGYPCNVLDSISNVMTFANDMDDFWEKYNTDKLDIGYAVTVPFGIKEINVEMIDDSDSDQEIERVNTKTAGNFFPYTLKKEFTELSTQLKRYQIYEKVDQIDKENCFVFACIMSKIFVKSEIEKIKTIVQGSDVTLTTIKELTRVLLFTCKLINVNNFTDKENTFYISKGVRHNSTKTLDKTLRTLQIVLDKRSSICYHYYLFENTPFSTYFIKNFLNVKLFAEEKEKSIEYYYNADAWLPDQLTIRTRSTVRKITSKELINYLFEENAFKEIPQADLCKCNFYFAQNKSMSDDLTNLILDSREIKLDDKEKKRKENHSIVYADFECTVQGNHKPFCICFCKENDNEIQSFYGYGCEIQFLNEVKKVKNPIVYFHNLSYDGRMLAKYGIVKAVLKCNKIYAMTVLFNGIKIKFRDSLALIPDKLSNFCQLFNLGDDGEKEIFPYNYYNEQTMFEGVVSQVGKEENPPWNIDQKNQFVENLNKLHLINDEKFNAKEYCIFYCKRDVDILKRGFNAFRLMTEKNLKIDVCSTLTISSLAYKCFLKNAFSNNDIYEFTGATRNYIRKAVIGGRCMTCENKKWKTGITHLDDFDACSLYPSAMRRLFIPQGIPFEWDSSTDLFGRLMKEDQVIATKNKDISNFIVTIQITKIGKQLKFPLIMTKKNGINMFVNELCEMTLDNIYLEDLIKYQQIEFVIKKGIYWVGNKSKKMSEYIKYIYDIRADMKKKKDSNQLIYKLIMNSAYGKTIQKPIDTDIVFKKGKKEFYKYLAKNYNKVLVFEEIGNEIYMIKLMKDVDDFYVPCHIGVLILSMSKRIMNEVICTAEDLNLQIYYQDTDSIHIEHNDLQQLILEYKNRFRRDLVGSNMGQFHSDFPPVKGKNSYSKESIFLGKKAYIDHLFNDDEEDDYCVRMKGVPSNTLISEANEKFEGNLMKMYSEMFDGKEITFDLLKGNAGIELKSNFTINTRKKFERKIKF